MAYTNAVKHALLDVPQDLLDLHGAVSAPVAEAMAVGCRQRLHTDLAVSTTGLAGPGGATPEKPMACDAARDRSSNELPSGHPAEKPGSSGLTGNQHQRWPSVDRHQVNEPAEQAQIELTWGAVMPGRVRVPLPHIF